MNVENYSYGLNVQLQPIETQKDPVDIDGVFYFVLLKRWWVRWGLNPRPSA